MFLTNFVPVKRHEDSRLRIETSLYRRGGAYHDLPARRGSRGTDASRHFPEINIPVVSVVWTYNGMSARDIQNRILSLHERQLASLVDDIARIEATSYQGVGVERIYLHEGADVSRAVSQLASSALVVLKYMPPNITPPLVLRYDATDVPIIQLSLASTSLPDTKLNDLGQNIIRPDLAVVHGAEVPQPYGGKPRVIMADLDAARA